MSIKYADLTEKKKKKSVIKYERSVITMTLSPLGYLVHSLGNCAITLPTKPGQTQGRLVAEG